jgi:selenide,water dikinase
MFGLSVNGLVELKHLKRNNSAKEGDLLFITKALGVGILSTAQKRQQLEEKDKPLLLQQLTQLNKTGEKLGKLEGVNAMTDVTGFGLLGHLIEMAEGSGLSAVLYYNAVPKIASLPAYIQKNTVPDATYRNWNAYNNKTQFAEGVNVMEAFTVLPDPQTNGGLLFSVSPESEEAVKTLLNREGLGAFCQPIGRMVKQEEKILIIN